MKKRFATLLINCILAQNLHAQLTKTNWLVGGSAGFTTARFKDINDAYKTTSLSLTPAVGYFVADRTAVGLKISVSDFLFHSRQITTGLPGEGHDFNLAVGPFARYYFIRDLEKPVNVFVEGSYEYGFSTSIGSEKHFLNRFSFAAGPAYYFNNSVALEFTLGYYHANQYDQTTTGIQARIGFQVHLEKEKK